MGGRCSKLSLCWWPSHLKSNLNYPSDLGNLNNFLRPAGVVLFPFPSVFHCLFFFLSVVRVCFILLFCFWVLTN
jgi:hypothetical protein